MDKKKPSKQKRATSVEYFGEEISINDVEMVKILEEDYEDFIKPDDDYIDFSQDIIFERKIEDSYIDLVFDGMINDREFTLEEYRQFIRPGYIGIIDR